MARLVGFPKPATAGPHFEALLVSLRQHGQTRPILIDPKGVVWEGRTLLNAVLELRLPPMVQVVERGFSCAIAGLAKRPLSHVEIADLVLAVYQNSDGQFTIPAAKRRSESVSQWFRENLGWTTGYSTRNIDHYLRLAQAPHRARKAAQTAESLQEALRLAGLGNQSTQGKAREPSIGTYLNRLITALEAGAKPTAEEADILIAIAAMVEADSVQICTGI